MLSHVQGSTEAPLLELTIGQAFDAAVAQWKDREALVVRHQDVRLTWAEFGERVDALANAFLRLGFMPGERVGMWATNHWEWAATQFATAKAGIILVTINPAYRLVELEYVLKKVGCAGLITGSRFKSSDYVAMLQELLPELDGCAPGQLRAARVPSLRTIIRLGNDPTPGMFNFLEILQPRPTDSVAALAAVAKQIDIHDAVNIQFTSGTTGAPKGVTLSHHNILNNAKFIGESQRLTPDDRICAPVPLYHCFGTVAANLVGVTTGATVVYPAESFEPGAVLKSVEAEQCTSLYGVPTMFIAALQHPDFASCDLSSLRTGIMAGAPCPEALMKQAVTKFHLPEITIAYGMTETSPVSFQSRVSDPVEKRVGTVGLVHPHAEVKVVDSNGQTVPRGEQGEVLTRGYLVMKGYWDDAQATAAAVDTDGFMHTGDLGTLDEQGWLRITGRVKDMVIRGGENIYPREIEEYLYTHPKIMEAQVVGVPDDTFGEELAVWIKLHDGEEASEDEIRNFCRGRIATYKIPRYVRFVREFPMTVTGKIQKFQIRRRMTEELGL